MFFEELRKEFGDYIERRAAGFCSNKKIQDEVLRIKAAADHGQIDMALAMIARAPKEVFEYPVGDSSAAEGYTTYKFGRDPISKADQYNTLLIHFLQGRHDEIIPATIERMTREQLVRYGRSSLRAVDYCHNDSNIALAMLEKLQPEDFLARSSDVKNDDKEERTLLCRYLSGSRNKDAVHFLIERTPAAGFSIVLGMMQSDQYSKTKMLTHTGARILDVFGPETVIEIVRKAPAQCIADEPGFYKAFKDRGSEFSYIDHGNIVKVDVRTLLPPVAKVIEEKMAGTLAPYVSQTAVMIHRPRSQVRDLPSFNPDEAIDVALASGRASDAMQVGREILDDCTTLLGRFHAKNLESIAAAAQASKVLRTIVAETREHAQLAEDVASGRKVLNPPGMIVRQLARFFPSLDPVGMLEKGLTGAGNDVRRSLSASQSLLEAYEDIQELRGPIKERLDHLQNALGRAVETATERAAAIPEGSKEHIGAKTLQEIFEATARNARVSSAMIEVNAITAERNAHVEGKFVVAVMGIQSALNVALTNASMALSQIKENVTPEIRREAALTIQDQSRQIAQRMEAFEGAVLERERGIGDDAPIVADRHALLI